jgi:hypothetical protein
MHQASQVSIGRFPLPQKQPRPFLPWELTAQGVSYMCRNSQVVKDTAKPQFGISRYDYYDYYDYYYYCYYYYYSKNKHKQKNMIFPGFRSGVGWFLGAILTLPRPSLAWCIPIWQM